MRLGEIEDIASLLHKASIAFHALPEAAQKKLMEEQRNSWLLGEDAIKRQERLQAIVDAHPLETHANMQEEVEFALTKLQGQLRRIAYLLSGNPKEEWHRIAQETSIEAEKWGHTLRTAIEKQRGYHIG